VETPLQAMTMMG